MTNHAPWADRLTSSLFIAVSGTTRYVRPIIGVGVHASQATRWGSAGRGHVLGFHPCPPCFSLAASRRMSLLALPRTVPLGSNSAATFKVRETKSLVWPVGAPNNDARRGAAISSGG